MVWELAALGLGRRQLHRVRGDSMRPYLEEGDLLIADPAGFRDGPPRPGDVVVVKHPYRALQLVKRVATVGLDGRIRVVGDSDDGSTDSRSFGAIGADGVLGRVTWRLSHKEFSR